MMKTALSATGRYLKQTDWLLMLCCVGLSSFSTLLIYSLYVNGEVGRLNTVLVQPAMAICGVAAAIVLSKIDYHLMARLWKWHTALCYGLLLLLFPFGVQRVEWVDDRNWLPIPFLGINFQPSELLKISFIVTFAYHLSRVKENLNRPKQLLGVLLHGAIPCAIIHLQGDDGTVLVMATIFASMLFVAGLSWKYILSVLALIPPAAIVAWNFFLDDDKKNRILAVINPALVDEASSWQQQRGIIAIPKTTHIDRMKENLDIFDFELSAAEMDSIRPLDRPREFQGSHRDPELVRFLLDYDKKFNPANK